MPQKPVPTRATTAGGTSGRPEQHAEHRAAGDVHRQRAQDAVAAAAGDRHPVGEQPQRRPDEGPQGHRSGVTRALAARARPTRAGAHGGRPPARRRPPDAAARSRRPRRRAPASISSTASTANVEYVVKPPSTPVARKGRSQGEARGAGEQDGEQHADQQAAGEVDQQRGPGPAAGGVRQRLARPPSGRARPGRHRGRPARRSRARVCRQRRRVSGKRRSTNRSTTGCGSWLASPGRSLASMKT